MVLFHPKSFLHKTLVESILLGELRQFLLIFFVDVLVVGLFTVGKELQGIFLAVVVPLALMFLDDSEICKIRIDLLFAVLLFFYSS